MPSPNRSVAVFIAALFLLAAAAVAPIAAVEPLKLCEARGLVQNAIDYIMANDKNLRVNIAVVDCGGKPIVSARLDGAMNYAEDLACKKARTAVMWQLPSGAIPTSNTTFDENGARFPFFDPDKYGFKADEHLRMAGLGGAYPIFRDGALIGAIAVAGSPTLPQDVQIALAAVKVTPMKCLDTIKVDLSLFPRLADAISRVDELQKSSVKLVQNTSQVVVDDLGRCIFFAKMDGCIAVGVELAPRKAKSVILTGMDSTEEMWNKKLFSPSSPFYTADNSNCHCLTMIPGGVAVKNAAGHVVGAVGVSGAPKGEIDAQIVADAMPKIAAPLLERTQTIALNTCYAVAQAALNKAFDKKASAVVAIADAGGKLKFLYAGEGSAPGSVDHAIAKAISAVTLPLPRKDVLDLCYAPQPGATDYKGAFNLANIGCGLVVNSGSAVLKNSFGVVVGGLGIFAESAEAADDEIADAGAAAQLTTLEPSAFAPPLFVPATMSNSSLRYSAELMEAPMMHAACLRGFDAYATNPLKTCPVGCVARDCRGMLTVAVVQDGAPAGVIDFAKEVATTSYVFPFESGKFQSDLNPYNGQYFTGQNAQLPQHTVAVAGGRPLLDPASKTVVGSIAFTGTDPALMDAVAVNATSFFTDKLASQSCQLRVKQFLDYKAQGDFDAALGCLSEDVSLVYPGPPELLPMAGSWKGIQGYKDFMSQFTKFFNFVFCAPPTIYCADPQTVFASFEECSSLKENSAVVPCPNNVNHVKYTCGNSDNNLITEIVVSVNNLCMAQAICESSDLGSHLQCMSPNGPVCPDNKNGGGNGADDTNKRNRDAGIGVGVAIGATVGAFAVGMLIAAAVMALTRTTVPARVHTAEYVTMSGDTRPIEEIPINSGI